MYKAAATEYFSLLEDSGAQLRADVLTVEEIQARENEIRAIQREVKDAEARLADAKRRLLVKISQSHLV